MTRIETLSDVVRWRLCLGCGACSYICPQKRVRLLDYAEEGIRPIADAATCGDCRACLEVCPAVSSDFTVAEQPDQVHPDLNQAWGPILQIWEGHASDESIRFNGASGGALTAISAYCLEVLRMSAVLHTGPDPDDPIRNRTRLSRQRSDLLSATGSRYSPAAVCDGLGQVEAEARPCVVIGKPSEIAAVTNARKMRPGLHEKIGLTMSFFCAETPSTRGTLALLERFGIEPLSVLSLRYRGLGWPGDFVVTKRSDSEPACRVSYRESWGFLQAYRPWSVQLWPDSSGELADITCGDPWYTPPHRGNAGLSLIIARNRRGKAIIEAAAAAGYLTLKEAAPWKLTKSQSNLLSKKGAVWGRRLALRVSGLPVGRLLGIDLRANWQGLSFSQKLKATGGTLRRVFTRKLYRPLRLDVASAVPVQPPGAPDCSAQ